MNKSEIILLYDYNCWANARVLDAAAGVSQEQFTAPYALSHSSLRGALAHTLGTEIMWRLRCQEGISPAALVAESEFSTLAALRRRWEEEERAMRAFLASLEAGALDRPVRYTNTKGKAYETPLWQILVHLVNHGTQFRSEAGVALTAYGCSPGDIDLTVYLRSR